MKNKTSFFIILVIVLLILAGLFFFLFGNKTSTNEVTNERAQDAREIAPEGTDILDDTENLKGNVFDLLKLGKKLQCSYEVSDEESTTKGTSYIAGNRMRGDFEIVTAEGETIESHMISDGEWMYSWSNQTDKGMKMKLEEAQEGAVPATDESEDNTTPDNTNENVKALQEKMDYKCTNWREDTSLFDVPTNIEFIDFSQMLKDVTSGGNSMCAACDYAPSDEEKTECKTRLGCN